MRGRHPVGLVHTVDVFSRGRSTLCGRDVAGLLVEPPEGYAFPGAAPCHPCFLHLGYLHPAAEVPDDDAPPGIWWVQIGAGDERAAAWMEAFGGLRLPLVQPTGVLADTPHGIRRLLMADVTCLGEEQRRRAAQLVHRRFSVPVDEILLDLRRDGFIPIDVDLAERIYEAPSAPRRASA